MSINQKPDLPQITTTKALKEIDLHYKLEGAFELTFYSKSKTGNFRQKTIKRNTRDVEYITHKDSNYSINNLYHHILSNEPIEKGISNKYTPRHREANLSFFARFMNWFRS